MFAALMLAGFVMMPVAQSEARNTLGSFVEIRHEEYLLDNGEWMFEYLVYERDTKLVYIYVTDEKTKLAITPYYMRDYYGEITIGLYNRETGGIDPAEPARLVDEDEVWDIDNH